MAANVRNLLTTFVVAVAVVLTTSPGVDANCKAHDASWDKVKGPTISQPSRVDPSKIKVEWGQIVTNGRCVDEYYIYVWKKNTPKESAVKIPVPVKTAVDHTIEVEACIEYNYMVESVEHDLFRDDIHQSLPATFKSEAVPRLTSTNKKDFVVGYFFDPTKGVNDLSKVSIRFPKSILEHASCIKHIEVKGTVDNLYSTASGAGRYYSQVVASQQQSSNSTHGYYLRSSSTYSSSSSSGIGGSGQYPGGSGVGGHGQYPGGSGIGGSGQYPGGSGIGGSGQYPGGSGIGGSGSYPGGSGIGGQGQYPGGGGSGIGGSGQYPGGSGIGGSGSYPGGSGIGGSGSYPGGSGIGGSGSYPGGSGIGGSGSYPGGSGIGGSGSYPGGSGIGGSGSYPGGSGIGGSGSYPGGSGIGGHGSYPGGQTRPDYHPNVLYPDHSHTMGWHGRPPYSQQASYPPAQGRVKRYTATTTLKPPIAYPTTTLKPPIGGGYPTTTRPPYVSGQPTVTASPPFLLNVIEILVDNVEPCKPYRFNLKIVSPQGSTLGEIDNLILPPLPDMADYHPPPLAQLFRVQLQAVGQPPIISLQPGLGVPAACLADFFEAVDRHMQRLEGDLQFHLGQESKAHGTVDYFKKQLSEEGSAQLKLLNCKCNSTSLVLTSKDPTVEQKFGHTLGTYFYDGMHQGRPYYRKPSRHQTIQPPQAAHSQPPPPVGGYGPVAGAPTTTTTTTTTPAPAAASASPVKIEYLYWDQSEKAWMVGETLGKSSPTLKTKPKSTAMCPADPESLKTWTYTSTFKWKDDETMKFDCVPNIVY